MNNIKTCKNCNTTSNKEKFVNAGNGKLKNCCIPCDSKIRKNKYDENLIENREKARIKALQFRKTTKGAIMKIQTEDIILELTAHIKYFLYSHNLAKDFKIPITDEEILASLNNLQKVLDSKIKE